MPLLRGFKIISALAVQFCAITMGASGALAQSPAPAATAKPSPPPRTPESAITPGGGSVQRHAVFLNRIKDGPVGLLFLGDSITDFWPKTGELTWLKFAPYNPADFGISGETTEQVLWRITNGELEGIHPKVVVIMIGTNNLGHFPDEKPEWVAAGIRKIVDTVKEKTPDAKILLLAVFPRGNKADAMRGRVDAVNKIISGYADGKTVTFLDIGDKFLDAQGEISPDIMPDKLHPSAKGYRIWFEAIDPTLQKLMR